MPELAEKRTVTGTSCLKCNALLTLAASALGTNLPSRTTPSAWADRCVVCLPNAALSASTNDSGVVTIAGSFPCVHLVGTIPSPEQISGAKYPKSVTRRDHKLSHLHFRRPEFNDVIGWRPNRP